MAAQLISAPATATADQIYEDETGRFTLPLVGDWTRQEDTEGFVRFNYSDMPMSMNIVTVEVLDFNKPVEAAFLKLGFVMDDLTEKRRGQVNRWNWVFYASGDGRGLNVLGQADATTFYLIIGLGEENIASNPPKDMFDTFEGFSFAGKTVLPTTVAGFDKYVADQIGATVPAIAVVVATGDGIL